MLNLTMTQIGRGSFQCKMALLAICHMISLKKLMRYLFFMTIVVDDRLDCNPGNANETDCLAKGCCFDPVGVLISLFIYLCILLIFNRLLVVFHGATIMRQICIQLLRKKKKALTTLY